MDDAAEIQYRVPWRTTSCYPGSHQGSQRGSGYELHGNAPFYHMGDPRRIDVRASLRDPFGQLLVRIYKQRSIVPVTVLADVSASMSFVGSTCKLDLLRKLAISLAYSAYKLGDPFAFVACDSVVRDELSLPPTRTGNASLLVSERLRDWVPAGTDSNGLLAGAERVLGSRALVFLISDFYFPIDLLRAVAGRLSRHAIVPVILADTAERHLPGAGLAHLYDSETGARRSVFFRRSTAKRLESQFREHRELLQKCLADFELRPLCVTDKFKPEDVSRYFNE
jgi:uncharacterized protein (DUF58 family)